MGSMGMALRKTTEDLRPYRERIRELVEADRVKAARELLAEALERGDHGEDLSGWQRVLAKGKPLGVVPGERDFDRTPDLLWIRDHAETYRGQWVALLGGELLAHSGSLDEVVKVLEANRPARSPLLHYIN
jgi:hypothetical protein